MKKETGKRCESCKQVKNDPFPQATIFTHEIKGIKGKDKDIKKYRRICRSCWDLALQNII